MKDKFFIIMAIVASIALLSCNTKGKNTNNTGSVNKQDAINYLNAKIDEVKTILETHANDAWDEDSKQYGLTGADEVFSLINHDQSNNNYSRNDNDAKKARREVYLALDYNDNNIKVFAEIFNKISERRFPLSPDKQSTIESILKGMRTYAVNYYEGTLKVLSTNKDKLDSLNVDVLNQIKKQLEQMKTTKDELSQLGKEIIDAYNNDAEVNVASAGVATSMKKIKSVATSDEILTYLKNKENDFKTKLQAINNGLTQMQTLFPASFTATAQP